MSKTGVVGSAGVVLFAVGITGLLYLPITFYPTFYAVATMGIFGIALAIGAVRITGLRNQMRFERENATQPRTVIIKEVVKTPCQYCGTLIDYATQTRCPSCGASLS